VSTGKRAFEPGDSVYLSCDGTLTKSTPTNIGEYVHRVGVVTRVNDNSVNIMVGNGLIASYPVCTRKLNGLSFVETVKCRN